jgi:hypothetical protein
MISSLSLVSTLAQADTIATAPNQLLGGLTSYGLRDYENVYDSNGNTVTTRSPSTGDSIQGVFVINQVSNSLGTAHYVADSPGAVELTGVFDSYVSGADASGNLMLIADTTSVVGQKAISGHSFQSTYGTGAMLAVYYNNINAMPVGLIGNGVDSLSTAAQAFSLASTNSGNGTLYATFGQGPSQSWGASNGYYWGARQAGTGVSTFAASLAMITNDTGIPNSQFAPITQPPPAGFSDPGLFTISNVFVIQGTTSLQTTGPYSIFSTDPARISFVAPIPEPSSLALLGVFLAGFAAIGRYRIAHRRK